MELERKVSPKNVDQYPMPETKEHSEAGWAYKVIYKDLRNCSCGLFESRMELLRRVLNDCPLYDSRNWYGSPLNEWFLCLLDGAGLIEHGSSIGGSWLTEKGERFLRVLNNQESWRKLVLSDDNEIGFCECEDCKE